MRKILLLVHLFFLTYLAFPNATISQKEWRWRKDDGSETSATWASNQEEGLSKIVCIKDTIRLRMVFQVDPDPTATYYNTTSSKSAVYNISYSNSPTGTFTVIPNTATNEDFELTSSKNVSNGQSTSQQLTSSGGSFASGQIVDNTASASITFSTPPGASTLTEIEWVIKPTSNAKAQTYYFKLGTLDSYPNSLPQLTLTNPVTGITVVNNISCKGLTDGQINLTPSGGTTPYSFDWGGNITTEDRTGLSSGDYKVIIADSFGCTDTIQQTITEPSVITASIAQDVTACTGSNGGSATVTASGGTGNLSYVWSTSNATTATATNLTPGTHDVTITDQNSCEVSKSIDIAEKVCTGVLNQMSDDLNANINLYPNPSAKDDVVLITNPSNIKIERVDMMDAQGRKVNSSIQEKITTVNLDAGMYYVQIVTDKGVAIKKLLIK